MAKILVIEDSLVFQRIISRLLQGHDVTIIEDPCEAKSLDLASFDLLVVDFMFSDGDSSRFLLGLRRRFSPEQLPVILVSGSMDEDLGAQFHQIGINARISKPLDNTAFPTLVNRLLINREVMPAKPLQHVALIHWETLAQFHVYCPALNHMEVGETLPIARSKMRAFLDTQQSALPTISSIKYTAQKLLS